MIDRLYAWYAVTPNAARGGARPTAPPAKMDGSTAVISLSGPLSRGGEYGGTSTDAFRAELSRAVADPGVAAIMLDVNSPGGSVAGTLDAASAVAAANRVKPVYASITDIGASAAYWIASQARQIFAGPSALVGSIGTMTLLVDDTAFWQSLGVKIHLVATGAAKGIGAPGQAVTQAQLDEVRRVVDSLNKQFLSGVASGRRMSPQQVDKLATGQVWIAAEAQALGLIDGVSTHEQVMTAIHKQTEQLKMTAQEELDSRVAEAIEKGARPETARAKILRDDADLRERMVAEANAGRPRR